MRHAMPLLLATSAALLATSAASHAGVLTPLVEQDGSLDKRDQTLDDGSFADVYPVDLQLGDRVLVEMSSRKLDTYLAVRSPGGTVYENDDYAGDDRSSQLDMFVEEAGTWLIYATSSQPGKRGSYHIRVAVDRAGAAAAAGAPPAPAPISSGEVISGSLGAGDTTLDGGEWTDRFTIFAQAGQELVVDMTSESLDTYVAVLAPSGESAGNDDFNGSQRHSRLEHPVEESGQWTVFATSYQAGQGGDYTLQVETRDPPAGAAASGIQRWSGTLDASDSTISSGEYAEVLTFTGKAGQRWVADLRSSDFDPFLILRAPDGSQVTNDDFEGAQDRSLLDSVLTVDGEHLLVVTTYRPGQTGTYDLTLQEVAEASAGGEHYTGTLDASDGQLTNGEWFDTYTFEGVPGQRMVVDLRGDFDTYLGVIGPGSFRADNDDAGDGSGHSQVEAVLSESGTHKVVVTSYAAGQGGAYTLDIHLEQGSVEQTAQRDVTALPIGQPTSGRLEEGDMTLSSGEYQDRYVIDVAAGQLISVTMQSSEFDPYIGLVLPDDSTVENDDWEGQTDTARVDLVAPQSGRYRVIATSYRSEVSGAYTVQASLDSAPISAPADTRSGNIYGVFVGISDYPDGGPSDLDFTADDARLLDTNMRHVGMDEGNGMLLTDSDATRAAFISAVQEQGARMEEGDLLVIFYSGHGGRTARSDFQPADPDGFDETLALYDGTITDDELAHVLDAISAGRVLLVLDSCFSGGFSKDIISRPDRMGLFSSHEDVTSAVAVKFQAGGYLARFMSEALTDQRADGDGDGALSALELSQYLYERYRVDVKSSFPSDKSGAYEDIVMTGRNLGYQQLIVDRGSVGPSQILFAW